MKHLVHCNKSFDGGCGASWPSVTQLRKERPSGGKGECPKCGRELFKSSFPRKVVLYGTRPPEKAHWQPEAAQ